MEKRGRGRPAGSGKYGKYIGVKFSPEANEWLRKKSRTENKSMSDLIRFTIDAEMQREILAKQWR